MLAEQYLLARGWKVHLVKRTSFGNNDIFGVADVEAKKVGERTLYIQVSKDGHVRDRIQAFEDVPWHREDDVQLWLWKGPSPTKGKDGPKVAWGHFRVFRRANAWVHVKTDIIPIPGVPPQKPTSRNRKPPGRRRPPGQVPHGDANGDAPGVPPRDPNTQRP